MLNIIKIQQLFLCLCSAENSIKKRRLFAESLPEAPSDSIPQSVPKEAQEKTFFKVADAARSLLPTGRHFLFNRCIVFPFRLFFAVSRRDGTDSSKIPSRSNCLSSAATRKSIGVRNFFRLHLFCHTVKTGFRQNFAGSLPAACFFPKIRQYIPKYIPSVMSVLLEKGPFSAFPPFHQAISMDTEATEARCRRCQSSRESGFDFCLPNTS